MGSDVTLSAPEQWLQPVRAVQRDYEMPFSSEGESGKKPPVGKGSEQKEEGNKKK